MAVYDEWEAANARVAALSLGALKISFWAAHEALDLLRDLREFRRGH